MTGHGTGVRGSFVVKFSNRRRPTLAPIALFAALTAGVEWPSFKQVEPPRDLHSKRASTAFSFSVTESDAASTVEDYHYEDPEAGWQAAGPLTHDEQVQWWAQFDAVPGVQGTPESDSLDAAPGVQDTPDSGPLTVSLPLTDNEFLHVTYDQRAEAELTLLDF